MGSDDCCQGCMRWLLFLVNIVTMCSGLAVLAIGSYLVAKKTYMEDLLGDTLFLICACLLIASGSIVVIISLFGCIGAVKESSCMLYTYSSILTLIFIFLLTAGIVAMVFKSDIKTTLHDQMSETMDQYGTNEDAKKAWDVVQEELTCCGVDGPSDWDKFMLPESCCDGDTCAFVNAYEDGCLEKVRTEIEDNAKLVGGIGIGVAVFMLVAIVFSCSLARSAATARYLKPGERY